MHLAVIVVERALVYLIPQKLQKLDLQVWKTFFSVKQFSQKKVVNPNAGVWHFKTLFTLR